MRIVIVGAGAVGSHLAERLSIEGQDVVVIDNDPAKVEHLQSTLDILAIQGNGASPVILEAAGIDKAELLIAVTSNDAVNVLACHAAARLGVPRKIARVEDSALRDELQILGVDVVIDPEEQLAKDLLLLVSEGGISEHATFGNGSLSLIGGFVQPDAPLSHMSLEHLRTQVTDWDWLVTAIVRGGDPFVARGESIVEEGDHVLIATKTEMVEELAPLLGITIHKAKKVMIFGAGRLARITANLLCENEIAVTLIDKEEAATRLVADECPGVIVVHGDPMDPELLRSEGIENVDDVLALTKWDEVNVVASLVAKGLGAKNAIARYHRLDYVSLLNETRVDSGVSSRLSAANAILRYVRRGRVQSVVTFQDSNLEAIELQVDPSSDSIGKTLAEIGLPKHAIVAGIIRSNETIIPRGHSIIKPGDHVVAVALPDAVPTVEKTFS
jgi:trk system potassium uptake protein TrkA